jgi:hypothetical protein
MEEKELNLILNNLIYNNGGSHEQYRNLMDQIAWHETGGTMDLEQDQLRGGPGRGKYQFESCEGCGGKTAANRAINFYKEQGIPVPQWLVDTRKSKSLDASKLDSDQQDILFLTNMQMHPTADFNKLWMGEQKVEDFWADYHWAGKDKDRADRIASFKESQKRSTIPSIFSGKEEGFQPWNSISNMEYDFDQQGERNYTFNPSSEMEYAAQPIDNTYVAPQQNYIPDVKPQQVNFKEPVTVESDQTEETSKSPTHLVDSQANFIQDYISTNQLYQGGQLPPIDPTQMNLNQLNVGGGHHENPYGGIPQGMGANGKMNTVEEGETSYTFDDGKYIFSNRTIIS